MLPRVGHRSRRRDGLHIILWFRVGRVPAWYIRVLHAWLRERHGGMVGQVIEGVGVMSGYLAGRTRRMSLALGGHDTLPAMGARIVFFQPNADALLVEPVVAWQVGDIVTDLHVVHAHAAFCFSVRSHHRLVDFLLGQGGDGGFGGGAGGGGAAALFHELVHDPVECFLAVDCVAVDGVGWVHDLG